MQEHGLVDSDVANATGCSAPTISRWRRGLMGISSDRLPRLLAALRRWDPTLTYNDLLDDPEGQDYSPLGDNQEET